MRLSASWIAAALLIAGACNTQDQPFPAVPSSGLDERPVPPKVITFRGDTYRRGVTPFETILTPTNVGVDTFGKKLTYIVDGYVYAQPLPLSGVTIAGELRAALFVATQHDSVYAFDTLGSSSIPLWKVSLLESGETPVPFTDTLSRDILPEIGITGTPVIDSTRQLLYVVSKAKRANGTYVQRLHALRLEDGSEAQGGPIDIMASVPGTATDAVNGMITFDPLRHNQRAALALIDGKIWITWASHGDVLPYHGWVMVYDAADFTRPPVAMVTTPDGMQGGIWMGASGPSSDGQGNVYVASGNGTFDDDDVADDQRQNFGLSELKLRLDNDKLRIVDWFSPHETLMLNNGDLDFGTIGAILMTDVQGASPHRLIAAAKTGMIYVLDRDDLGHFNALKDRVVQSFSIDNDFLISNPAFFDDTLYVCPHKGPLSAYKLDPETGLFDPAPIGVSPACPSCFQRGSTPTISAHGTEDAIVWVIDNSAAATHGAAILHAYDAADITHELYNSKVAPNYRDTGSAAVKFTTPTISNGRVYIGSQLSVTVYGLLDR